MYLNTFWQKGKHLVSKASDTAKEKTLELTEEAVTKAVDQAVNIIEIASQRVRKSDILSESVSLEVTAKIGGLIEIKLSADVPHKEDMEGIILDADSDTKLPIGAVSISTENLNLP